MSETPTTPELSAPEDRASHAPGDSAAPTPETTATESFWPGPKAAATRLIPLAVVVGGLSWAIFLPPLPSVGVGWFLAALLTTAAVMAIASRARVDLPIVDRVWRTIWGLSAIALLSVLAFRNAWWLVTFCVLGALGCASLAVAGGRVIRTMLFGLVLTPIAVLRSVAWIGGILERPGSASTSDIKADANGDSENAAAAQSSAGGVRRMLWSVVVTAALLLVFGALFASADAAFATVLGSLVPDVDAATTFRFMFFLVLGTAVTAAAGFLASAPPDLRKFEKRGTGRLRWTEWALPIGALVVLFGGFVAVQITVLFGGRDHVLRTSGLTFAEYARSGFIQLAFVTVLTLVVIAATAHWAARESGPDRLALRILLGLLSALTLVIVASAISRMYAYQEGYSFTGERIFVMALEFTLGLFFVMILLAGIRLSGAWVPRAMVAALVAMLLGLAVLNPELYAATRNVERYEKTQKIDLWYLRALSADATPALIGLPAELRACTLMWISDELSAGDGWTSWNFGRQRARRLLRDLGPGAVGDCSKARQWDYRSAR